LAEREGIPCLPCGIQAGNPRPAKVGSSFQDYRLKSLGYLSRYARELKLAEREGIPCLPDGIQAGNPRPAYAGSGFQDRRLKPLGHLSRCARNENQRRGRGFPACLVAFRQGTHVLRKWAAVFKTAALNHSATSPDM